MNIESNQATAKAMFLSSILGVLGVDAPLLSESSFQFVPFEDTDEIVVTKTQKVLVKDLTLPHTNLATVVPTGKTRPVGFVKIKVNGGNAQIVRAASFTSESKYTNKNGDVKVGEKVLTGDELWDKATTGATIKATAVDSVVPNVTWKDANGKDQPLVVRTLIKA
jgi:hypothetical protein